MGNSPQNICGYTDISYGVDVAPCLCICYVIVAAERAHSN